MAIVYIKAKAHGLNRQHMRSFLAWNNQANSAIEMDARCSRWMDTTVFVETKQGVFKNDKIGRGQT